MKISGGTWVKTRKCGCGDCASGYSDVGSGECPLRDAPDAKWLWASDYSSEVEPTPESMDSDFSILDKTRPAEVEVEIEPELEADLSEEVEEDRDIEEPVLVEISSGELEDN